METLGVGLDLCEIVRVGRLLEKYPRFQERCFTEHEREYANGFALPARRFAARFAGKEAVMKSLGTGYRQIRWQDVEITGGGAPTVNLRRTASRRAAQLGGLRSQGLDHSHGRDGNGHSDGYRCRGRSLKATSDVPILS
jgi:holo-[acyl-carrier protein] synthase